MDEFRLIRAIARRLGAGTPDPRVVLGIGDDAAVLAPTGPVAATTDTLVEGVHFRFDWMSARDVGWRAAQVNLSDLAAMGARPLALLVAVDLPRDLPDARILQVASGIGAACRAAGTAVVGGNITSTPGPLAVCITALGEVGTRFLTRSGARPGDALWVSGPLGVAAMGREALARDAAGAPRRWPALVGAYRRPRARLDLAGALVDDPGVHGAIDLSDGLLGDLGHVLEASGVGAEVDLARVPLHPQARRFAAVSGADALGSALSGGDDYELLAFGEPACPACAGAPWVRVGTVTRRRGLRLAQGGRSMPVPDRTGWMHR